MKYVVLIHSNPRPWGHPTADFLPEHRALPDETKERLGRAFDERFAEVKDRGELVHAEALGAPSSSRLYRWQDGAPVTSDGPYAETTEHLAGFFVLEVESQERAEEIAAVFAGPGETIELRPVADVG